MQPIIEEGLAGSGFALGNLVRMMDIDMVNAAAVNIELTAEIFQTDSRTFDMPARKTDAPRRWPFHLTLRISG